MSDGLQAISTINLSLTDQQKIDELERELARLKIDNAGALQRKYLDRSLISDFESYRINPKPDLISYYLVRIGELDRANDEGGRDVGTKALQLEVTNIKTFARESLRPYVLANNLDECCKIYRFSGSDFLVRLESPTAAIQVFHDFEDKVLGTPLNFSNNSDEMPVGCASLTQTDAIRIMNQINSSDSNDFKDIVLEALNTKAQMSLKLQTARSLIDSYGRNRKLAKERYSKYDAKIYEGGIDNVLSFMIFGDKHVKLNSYKHLLKSISGITDLKLRSLSTEIAEKFIATIVPGHIFSRMNFSFSNKTTTNAQLIAKEDYQNFTPDTEERKKIQAMKIDLEIGVNNNALSPKKRRIKELEIEIADAKIDDLTGLPNRSEYYKDLEAAIASGYNVEIIFHDIAYLKYLNNVGGRQLGDYALKLGAHTLNKSKISTGVPAKNYRIGGDEMATLVWNPIDTARIIKSISDFTRLAGSIKKATCSSKNYEDVPLTINSGVATTEEAMAMQTHLESERLSPPITRGTKEYNKKIAEMQTTMADMAVSMNKYTERILTFMELVTRPEMSVEKLNLFHKFSAKSLFNMSLQQIKELNDQTKSMNESEKQIFISNLVKQKSIAGLEHKKEEEVKMKLFRDRS